MFRLIKRTRRRIRDWFKDRSRYLRWQWHRMTSGVLVWWESLKTTHEDGPGAVVESAGKRGRPALKAGSFFNPFFWFAGAFQFLLRYLFSRRPLDFFFSVPGVFGIVAPFASLNLWLPDADALTGRYRSQMQVCAAARDFDQARFYADCWKKAQPANLEVDLSISLLDEAAGDLSAAQVRLRELIVRYQYEPAIILYSRRELPEAVKGGAAWTPASLELQQVLAGLLQIQPDHTDAGFMLSTLYVARKEWRNALTLLRQFSGRPSALQANFFYTKAAVELELQMFSDSRRSARLGADLLTRQLMLNPANRDLLVQTVQCLTMAALEAEAVQLLNDRVAPLAAVPLTELSQQDQQLRLMLADVLASRCRRLRSEPLQTDDSVSEAVSCLSTALQIAPNNGIALEELSRLALADLSGESEAVKNLQGLLDSGVEPGLLHFILGSQALKKGSSAQQEATAHFEKAMAHGADFPGILNNFANLIADSESGDLEAADRMVQQALKQLPGQAELYDTRGKIRLRQGRFSEAIADFETALKEPRIRGEVYLNLSRACRQAGDETSAQRYEKLAGRP